MLPRTIDPGIGFFVEKDPEFMLPCHPLHNIHQKLVMINCKVNLLIYRSAFKLVGSNLVMAGFHWNTKFMGLAFKVLYKAHDPPGYRSEIMVGKLLIF